MKGDLICCDGRLIEPGCGIMPFDSMAASDFLYQKIHTIGHKPLHAQAHIELLDAAFKTMYGTGSGLSALLLEEEAARLLGENRYPMGSNQIVLYLFPAPDGKSAPVRVLSCEKQLLYKGYELWHTAEKALILPYDYQFPHFKTAVSLAAHTYATAYAARKGAGLAIAENHVGGMYSVGENPLFAVAGDTLFTPAIGEGACDSVERRLGITAAESAEMRVVESPIRREHLPGYHELFTVNPGGVVSIRECCGNIYSHSAAKRVAEAMKPLAHTSV